MLISNRFHLGSCCSNRSSLSLPSFSAVQRASHIRTAQSSKPNGKLIIAPPQKPPKFHAKSSQAKPQDEDDEDEYEDEDFLLERMPYVVKIFCIHTEPHFGLPWQRKRQASSSSTGFVCNHNGQRYLLTNAHSVEFHSQVKVKRRGDDQKYLAKVISIGVDCDVAALEVEDPSFWEPFGTDAIEFGDLPRLQDSVAVVGYPIGGDTISVTAGVVSRIEVTDYSHGSSDLLAIQIDAAINGGNSGGPVFSEDTGECIGIAFQALVGEDIENVGYVIPASVVIHFLEDLRVTGRFNGFPALGVQWQRLESPALRLAYGMTSSQKGVLIRKLNPTSHAVKVLRPDDIITKFDGVEISNDGTVPFRTGERIAFSYLISQRYIGDEVEVEVLRKGELLKFTLPLSTPRSLIPPHTSNQHPQYFIVAGLVFTVANEPYLREEYGQDWNQLAPVKLMERKLYSFPTSADEEVVLLSQVLACDATIGYEDVQNTAVISFNDHPVRNLLHLAEMVLSCSDPYLSFTLDHSEKIVISSNSLGSSTEEVMVNHSIPASMSPELKLALDNRSSAAPS
jgi:S1-C subfamily serine protease